MDSDDVSTDKLIDDLGGCGKYQWAVVFFVFWVKMVGAMSMVMMAFGNKDPGWQCLDNFTLNTLQGDNLTLNATISKVNGTTPDSCDVFEACSNVQFAPEMSTIVSEYHLVCGNAHIPSLIISIQMFGVLVGAYMSGYLGDRFGRKISLYGAVLFHLVMNVIAIFSYSWQMFVVLRFLIGLAIPFMIYLPGVLSIEFVPFKWRNFLFCFPFFAIGSVFMALVAMLTENWQYIHGAIALASGISLCPFIFMPESLRWLLINNKTEKASSIVKSISKMNGKGDKGVSNVEEIANLYRNQQKQKSFSCHLLLRKGFRYPTFVVGFICAAMSIIYYAIAFNVKTMPGGFYLSMFLIFSIDIPIAPFSSFIPNYLGRKWTIIAFLVLCTINMFIILALDLTMTGTAKNVGILICSMIARGCGDAAWDIAITYTGELFPTMIRSTSVAYCNWIAKIGAIIAPYFIPSDPESFFINYLIMAFLALLSSVTFIFVPETKGKPLLDMWKLTVSDAGTLSEFAQEGQKNPLTLANENKEKEGVV